MTISLAMKHSAAEIPGAKEAFDRRTLVGSILPTRLEAQASQTDATIISALTADSFPELLPTLKMSRGISLGSWNSLHKNSISLYGRSSEVLLLRSCYARIKMPNAPSEIVVLHGERGIGKSTLVESLRDLVASQNGYFVSGKYDQHRAEPYSAIVAAVTDVIDLISQSRDVATRRATLQQELREELPLLIKLISGLSYFMDPVGRRRFEQQLHMEGNSDGNMISANMGHALHRFKHCCRKLMRALSSPNHPMVFFIDDMQWSQPACRELIASLLTDEESKNILFVCAYDEGDDETTGILQGLFQNVTSTVHKDARKGPIRRVTDMELTNLGLNDINLMLSDMLEVNPASTWSLSEVTLAKTHGNPYFVWHFLDLLQKEGLLCLPQRRRENDNGSVSTTSSASWQLDRIRSETNVSANVLPIVTSKIQKLPTETQSVLSVASFIGYEFDAKLLRETVRQAITIGTDRLARTDNMDGACIFLQLLDSQAVEFDVIMTQALEEGLVERIGVATQFKFSHDQVQECFYGRVEDETETQLLHLLIGRQLEQVVLGQLDTIVQVNNDKLLFETVDHLNKGSQQIDETNEFVRLARSNLQVAKKAIEKAAFATAVNYLTAGIAALNTQTMWRDHYSLSLELSATLAKMQYATGDFERCNKLVVVVLNNTATFDDRFQVCDLTIRVLFAQGKTTDAIRTAVGLLNLVDGKMPLKPTKLGLARQARKTQRLLKGKSDESICALPLMTDKKDLMIAKIYYDIARISFFGSNAELGACSCLRVVQLTMQRGLNEYCPTAFSLYGIFVRKESLQSSYKYGKLALRLVDVLQQREAGGKASASAAIPAHCMLLHLKDHQSKSIKPFHDAAEACLQNGDVEYGLLGRFNHALSGLLSGQPLQSVEENLQNLCQQMKDFRQDRGLRCTLPLWQAIQNLMGLGERSHVLDGDAMTEADFLSTATSMNDTLALQIWCYVKFVLAFFFGATCQASDLLEEMENESSTLLSSGHFHAWTCKLLAALTYCNTLRKRDVKKFRRKVKGTATEMRKMVSKGCVNVGPHLLLLEAETQLLNLQDDVDGIIQAFERAMASAKDMGFTHIEALANERLGLWLLQQSIDKRETAHRHVQEAIDLFEAWGAYAVVERLEEKVGIILSSQACWRRRSATDESSIPDVVLPKKNKRVSFKGV